MTNHSFIRTVLLVVCVVAGAFSGAAVALEAGSLTDGSDFTAQQDDGDDSDGADGNDGDDGQVVDATSVGLPGFGVPVAIAALLAGALLLARRS